MQYSQNYVLKEKIEEIDFLESSAEVYSRNTIPNRVGLLYYNPVRLVTLLDRH